MIEVLFMIFLYVLYVFVNEGWKGFVKEIRTVGEDEKSHLRFLEVGYLDSSTPEEKIFFREELEKEREKLKNQNIELTKEEELFDRDIEAVKYIEKLKKAEYMRDWVKAATISRELQYIYNGTDEEKAYKDKEKEYQLMRIIPNGKITNFNIN